MARNKPKSHSDRMTISESQIMQKKLSEIHAEILLKTHHNITHSNLIECIIALATKNYSAAEVASTVLAYRGNVNKAWTSQ